MPAAKRSHKAAIKNQKDQFLSFKIAQLYRVSSGIDQFKIRRWGF